MIRVIHRSWNRGEGLWIASEKLDWLAERLHLPEKTEEGLPLVWFGPAITGPIDRFATRCLDLVLCSAGLLIGLPLWILLAVFIRRDGGPVFYVSRRVGRSGRPFTFVKFRSMAHQNNDSQHRNFMKRVIRGAESEYVDDTGKPVLKNPSDGRVTGVGRFMRRMSLDETPQFLHVISSHMSVVGPRPPIPYEVECYDDWMHARVYGRVGITGLWQVNGRNELGFDDQVLLDIYYLANRNLRMDIGIIAKTPGVMLSGRGAY